MRHVCLCLPCKLNHKIEKQTTITIAAAAAATAHDKSIIQ